MTDAIVPLSDFVAGSRFDDLSPDAVAATKTFLIDSLGVAVAGGASPWAARLTAAVGAFGAGEESRVLVDGARLPAPSAALVNAWLVHNSEFDCVHEKAVVHAFATVLPAALAEAERQGGIDGRRFIAALALGVDVACRIGLGGAGALRFFRPGTAGCFGATAAIGWLRGFDAPTLTTAMGAALGQLCGTMQAHAEGSAMLPLQIGFNARNAFVACALAERGFPTLAGVLQGAYGYFALFEADGHGAPDLSALGERWMVTELSHKPYPSGRATHGIIEAILTLRRRHGFAADDVKAATASVTPLVKQLVGRPARPGMAANEARLCAAFLAARAIRAGSVGTEDFGDEALGDPATIALAERVSVTPGGAVDPDNPFLPVAVAVVLRDGRELSMELDKVLGSPANPLPRAANLEKFRRNWQSGAVPLSPAKGERAIALVDQLEDVADVVALVDLTLSDR